MLESLRARGFRNLDPLALEVGGGVHLVLGSNGAGKTSLLEAIYLLATTRSFRTSQVADCCHHGSDVFTLSGEASRARLEVAFDAGRRRRSVNGSSSSLAEHLAVLPVVAWTAADVEVLIGSPAERRRFLDRGVLGQRPAALEVLARYRRALQEKRRLLQRGAPAAELEVWNRVLAEAAAALAAARARYSAALADSLGEVLDLCELGTPPISLTYRPSPKAAVAGSEAVVEALAAAAERERKLERALLGPHRDELEILWDGRDLRRVASAGERKALGLALAIAHGRVLEASDRPPTYLLDDVDTELDRGRLESLWRVLGRVGQLFATSNRPAILDDLYVTHRWRCEAGRLDAED